MATRYSCVMQRIPLRLVMAMALSGAGFAMAQAQAQTPAKKPGDLPLVISLDAADCRRLVAQHDAARIAHQPNADVTYRPGRDVDSRGRPVPPADLPGSNQTLLSGPLELPVSITLSELLGSRTPARIGVSELSVVKVGIDPMSGKVAFNGQPLEARGEDAVVTACREYLASQPKPR